MYIVYARALHVETEIFITLHFTCCVLCFLKCHVEHTNLECGYSVGTFVLVAVKSTVLFTYICHRSANSEVDCNKLWTKFQGNQVRAGECLLVTCDLCTINLITQCHNEM